MPVISTQLGIMSERIDMNFQHAKGVSGPYGLSRARPKRTNGASHMRDCESWEPATQFKTIPNMTTDGWYKMV